MITAISNQLHEKNSVPHGIMNSTMFKAQSNQYNSSKLKIIKNHSHPQMTFINSGSSSKAKPQNSRNFIHPTV